MQTDQKYSQKIHGTPKMEETETIGVTIMRELQYVVELADRVASRAITTLNPIMYPIDLKGGTNEPAIPDYPDYFAELAYKTREIRNALETIDICIGLVAL